MGEFRHVLLGRQQESERHQSQIASFGVVDALVLQVLVQVFVVDLGKLLRRHVDQDAGNGQLFPVLETVQLLGEHFLDEFGDDHPLFAAGREKFFREHLRQDFGQQPRMVQSLVFVDVVEEAEEQVAAAVDGSSERCAEEEQGEEKKDGRRQDGGRHTQNGKSLKKVDENGSR